MLVLWFLVALGLCDDSLRWGPYRSGHYVGVRPRFPNSLVSGLMWFNVDTQWGISKTRHFFEQNDDMARANWIAYDPRWGGRQEISDSECHINITVDFVKSENGRNWGLSVRVVPHEGHENVKTAFVWYLGLENDQPMLSLKNKKQSGYAEPIRLSGLSEELGLFELAFFDETGALPSETSPLLPDLDPSKIQHLSLRVPAGNVWKAKEIFLTLLQDSVKGIVETFGDESATLAPEIIFTMRNMQKYEGNMHFIEKMYEGEGEFLVLFNELESPPTEKITRKNIHLRTKEVLAKVEEKFAGSFSVTDPFGKEMLSGLLGGLSYFHGSQLVDRTTLVDSDDLQVSSDGGPQLPKFVGKEEGPHELFTLVPSRPFFPRGFYWDEGFHLLPVLRYDSDLALEIMQLWFSLIDDDGWIAREQILGAELRLRVPELFQTQSSAIVNPPTLLLAFSSLLEARGSPGTDFESAIVNDPARLANYTRQVFPKLKAHFEHFRRTQRGLDDFGRDAELFRWRGRTETHCLASGLDDYPRVLPMDDAELNVDLLCWVGVMARSLRMAASVIGEDEAYFAQIEAKVVANIDSVHWSPDDRAYCDVLLDDDDEPVFACFKGYISLFPFLTRLVPLDKVDKIGAVVDLLADPEELWLPYGIRSLSKSSEHYKTGEDYWRLAVWVHVNYLVLEGLAHYHAVHNAILKEKIERTYAELRRNVIANVRAQWEKTGFVWELYKDDTGEAKGAKNFLGWTSTVLLMMEMPEELGK